MTMSDKRMAAFRLKACGEYSRMKATSVSYILRNYCEA